MSTGAANDNHPPEGNAAPDSTWAVMVVHGVGESSPGATLGAFVPTVLGAKTNLEQVSQSVWTLPEPRPQLPQRSTHTSAEPTSGRSFDVQYREFRVAHAPPDTPTKAVFAEVFWADLSSAGDRIWDLVLRLFNVLFQLRHLAFFASSLPDFPLALVLRWILYLASWLLCGPIAALNLFGLYLLLVRWALGKLQEQGGFRIAAEYEEWTVVGLAVAGVLLGGFFWLLLRKNENWDAIWSLVAKWFGVVGLAVAGFALYRMSVGPDKFWQVGPGAWIAGHLNLNLQEPPKGMFAAYLGAILSVIQLMFVALGIVSLLAFVVWLVGLPKAKRRGLLPAFNAAIGSTYLQLGLWVILVPAITLLLVAALKQGSILDNLRDPLFAGVRTRFALHLSLALLIGLTALFVVFRRSSWVRKYRGGFAAAMQAHEIPRLLINAILLYLVVLFSVLGSGFFVYSFFSGDHWLEMFLDGVSLWVAMVVVVLLGMVGMRQRTGLGSWLHIITDITNHFYRPRLPWPSFTFRPFHPNELPIQQRIEARFRGLLWHLLQKYNVTHLTVVSHSQGTVISIDSLWLDWTHDLLKYKGVQHVHFVTMGSPLTHLYQYYFPNRYEPLYTSLRPSPVFNQKYWGDLDSTVQEWINIYRVDDFVGTCIDGDPARPFPREVCLVKPGGHTGYWSDTSAIKEMLNHLAGNP